jgi:hypothetical protein
MLGDIIKFMNDEEKQLKKEKIQTFLDYMSWSCDSAPKPVYCTDDECDLAIVGHFDIVSKYTRERIDRDLSGNSFRWNHNLVDYHVATNYMNDDDTYYDYVMFLTYSYDIRHPDDCFIISTVYSNRNGVHKKSHRCYNVGKHFACDHPTK